MTDRIPVVTIDGPSGSGKGTVAQQVAETLGWHLLDSGALYRLAGFATDKAGTGFDDEAKIADIASNMQVGFEQGRILLGGEDVTDAMRTEAAGNNASRVAAMPAVRAALLEWQRSSARAPGLVADGRDMGTTVFPAAEVKIFLTASAGERARRRYKQLKEKGFAVNLAALEGEIRERDARDSTRAASPLVAAGDALTIDSTDMPVTEVVARILAEIRRTRPVD